MTGIYWYVPKWQMEDPLGQVKCEFRDSRSVTVCTAVPHGLLGPSIQ